MSDNGEKRLPHSWIELALGEARVDRSRGIVPSKQPNSNFELYSVPSFDSGKPEIVQGQSIGSNKQTVETDTVLLCKINPRINRVWVVENYSPHPKIASTEWIPFFSVRELLPKYLCYYMRRDGFRNHLASQASGVGGSLMRIKASNFADLPVPIAPVPEQHRIVAKIEELFSELDKGIESLKAARAKLDIYRQAVLKHAFEGKLTAQWRQENKDKLESPEQLLARIKQEWEARYEQQLKDWKATGRKGSKPRAPKTPPLLSAEELAELPELPDGWVWTRFGLLDIELRRGPFGSSITKSMFVPSGYKVYEQGNAIYRDASRGSYFINAEKYEELSGFTVLPGDFIVSCAGTVGRLFELPENAMAGVINQALMRVRINDTILSRRFFARLFDSAFFQRKILLDAKGTAMTNLAGIKELNLVPVAICNTSEQKTIDEMLDARLPEIDQCERTIANSLQHGEALRQSILKRAFSGRLVPQDPRDEPASVLLNRIRAEREKAMKNNHSKKTKKRKTTA